MWHLDPSIRLATIDTGRKLGVCAPFRGEGDGSPSDNDAWAEAYLHVKCHLDVSSRLATIDMGRKLERGRAVPPFWSGDLGPHLAQCGLAEA